MLHIKTSNYETFQKDFKYNHGRTHGGRIAAVIVQLS